MKSNKYPIITILLLIIILISLWWMHKKTMNGQAAIRDSISGVRHMLSASTVSNLKNGLFSDATAFNTVVSNYQSQYPKASGPIQGKDNTIWGYSINPAIVNAMPPGQTSFNIANALDENNDIIFYLTASTYQEKKDRCPTFCDVEGCTTGWQELSNLTAPTGASGGTSQTQNFTNTYLQLLPKGVTINRANYNDIMSQTGCRFVRVYYGIQYGSLCAVMVGVKSEGDKAVDMKEGKMYFEDYRFVRF